MNVTTFKILAASALVLLAGACGSSGGVVSEPGIMPAPPAPAPPISSFSCDLGEDVRADCFDELAAAVPEGSVGRVVITDQYDHGYSLVRTYWRFSATELRGRWISCAGDAEYCEANPEYYGRHNCPGQTHSGLYGVQSVACAVGVPITPDLTAADIPRGLILTNAVSVDPRLSVLESIDGYLLQAGGNAPGTSGIPCLYGLQDGDAGADPTACTGAYAQGRVLKIVWLAQDGTSVARFTGQDGSIVGSSHCGDYAIEFCIGISAKTALADGGVRLGGGTSLAIVHAGIVLDALFAVFPDLTTGQGFQVVLGCGEDLGAPGPDEIFGQGRLSVRCVFTPRGELTTLNGLLQASGALQVSSASAEGVISVAAGDGTGRTWDWSPVRDGGLGWTSDVQGLEQLWDRRRSIKTGPVRVHLTSDSVRMSLGRHVGRHWEALLFTQARRETWRGIRGSGSLEIDAGYDAGAGIRWTRGLGHSRLEAWATVARGEALFVSQEADASGRWMAAGVSLSGDHGRLSLSVDSGTDGWVTIAGDSVKLAPRSSARLSWTAVW